MNAPTAPAAVQPLVQMIPLADIEPSTTHIQALRRKRFDKTALQELADSIQAVGLLQPVVVVDRDAADYELVAGERRFLAAQLAGLAEIPATVRELTPEQILEVQLIENLQREGLHELEEAEGYDELMKLKGINADAVAEMVGKSRSYVYGRTKLLALCPEARTAFYAGEIDASKALLLARIGHHDTQRQAMKDITKGRWGNAGPMSFRDAQRHVHEHYMLALKSAPFDTKSTDLVPAAGACAQCPKRTGNDRDLFGDVKSADVCTDPKCFDDKRQAHFAGRVRELEAKGHAVITGDAAKKLVPNWDSGSSHVDTGRYARLDQQDWGRLNGRRPRDVLGGDYVPTLVIHPLNGTPIAVAPLADIEKAVKGGKHATKKKSGKAARAAGPKLPDIDDILLERLLTRVAAHKLSTRSALAELLRHVLEMANVRDDELKLLGKVTGLPGRFGTYHDRRLPAEVAKLDERALLGLLFCLALLSRRYNKAPVLKYFGIIEAREREQIVAERKAAAAKAREAARVPVIEKRAKAARSVNARFMAPMQPGAVLFPIVGDQPLPRTEVTKKVWAYIKRHALHDQKSPRFINADAALAAVFGGRKRVSMFEMTKWVGKHLREAGKAPTKAKAKGKKK